MNKKLPIIVILVTAIFTGCLSGCNNTKSNDTPTENTTDSNTKADEISYIDFPAETLDGTAVSLSDFIDNECVVVNFWATWCSPCRSEMDTFYNMEKEFAEKGVVFIMMNMTDGQRETPDTVQTFLTEEKLDFQHVLLDKSEDIYGQVGTLYGITAIPSTLFINKDGIIKAGYKGAMEENTLRTQIENVID